jgi:hypothetical protein
MISKLKDVLERAREWPEAAQQELADIALELEASLGGVYRATPEELQALDEAEQSGIASDDEVEAAFKAFRRA